MKRSSIKVKKITKRNSKKSLNKEKLPKIVLVGNPNVGKSLVFNKLTGAYVTVSNYPGTTVGIDRGVCKINDQEYSVIDTPGMYSLIPITEEEQISKLILFEEKPKIVLHVVDAKNLNRMLPFTLQLIEANLPVILILNMMDEAKKQRIEIDTNELENKLGIPVVPMIATTGFGLKKLHSAIYNYEKKNVLEIKYSKNIEFAITEIKSLLKGKYSISKRSIALLLLQQDNDTNNLTREKEGERYNQIEKIINKTESIFNHPLRYIIKIILQKEIAKISSISSDSTPLTNMDFREKISRIMINPITGIPVLFLILYFGLYQFVGVLGAGELVDLIEGQIFGDHINPVITDLVIKNIPFVPIQELIVGEFGIVTLGLTYAIAIILPIVGTFFLVFSIIEDSGYLPRLALLIDRIFKKIGLSGRAIIPMVIGLGCDTMATVVTRTQETNRERVISTFLLALAIPCSAQLGVIFAILSGHPKALFVWFIVIIFNLIFIGFLLSKILPGDKPSFYMELPPLRLPKLSNVLTKTYTRMVWYFKEIIPIFLVASILIWIFQLIGIFQIVISWLEPVVSSLGLPNKTASVFLFGFFRRDYGAVGLFEMQNTLTGVQLTVAAVTLTLFVPCIAQFMIMIKERGLKTALSMFIFILFFAFGIGYILNQILITLGVSL